MMKILKKILQLKSKKFMKYQNYEVSMIFFELYWFENLIFKMFLIY